MREETKNILRGLVNSREWQALNDIAEETKTHIKSDSVLKDTSEETMKEVYLQEGEVRGIKRLLDNIFNTIQ